MSWLVSAKQYIPAVIGESFGGGYFAGYISHTADGNPTHALIVAPKATGASGSGYTLTTAYSWKNADTATSGTASTFNGKANTDAIVAAGLASHPAAEFCVNLSIGGFADWYLPAMDELEIAYFNLKPDTTANNTFWGSNNYSVPKRVLTYSSAYPAQTGITAFAGGSESFALGGHWVSTTLTSTNGSTLGLTNGQQGSGSKTSNSRVRAFRRIAL
jgi:hypothetical protein